MKAKLLFPVVALIAVTNTFSAEAEVVPINIVREPTPPGSEVLHRAPAQVPISCFLEDDSYVVVNFFADLGTVSVCLRILQIVSLSPSYQKSYGIKNTKEHEE